MEINFLKAFEFFENMFWQHKKVKLQHILCFD
jgi:hypothetical protein